MKLAERDGIWSRGGQPVEELPDPFAEFALPDVEAPLTEQPRRRRWPIYLYSNYALILITLI